MTPNLEPKNLLSMPKPINTAAVDSKKPLHESESPTKQKRRSESKSKSPQKKHKQTASKMGSGGEELNSYLSPTNTEPEHTRN